MKTKTATCPDLGLVASRTSWGREVGPIFTGRVKRLLVEVELDLDSLEEPAHEGQGAMW